MSVWVDLNAAGFVIIQSAVTAELTRTGAVCRVHRVLLGRRPGPVRVTLVTGLLSTVPTSDAALIAIGSLVTHGVRRPHHVLLPALVAANSLGAITPLGNPQNVIIYAHYRVDAREFVTTQLPIALALMVPVSCTRTFGRSLPPSHQDPTPSSRGLRPWWWRPPACARAAVLVVPTPSWRATPRSALWRSARWTESSRCCSRPRSCSRTGSGSWADIPGFQIPS